mmetsp:Transcript_46020/g.103503  ORF Transcript_46020/g.103503 Transcript_46020/m.103503 type:complete len:121 (-) Transcript_46020:18-380(-)
MALALRSPLTGSWSPGAQPRSGLALLSPVGGRGLGSYNRMAGGGGILNCFRVTVDDLPVNGHKFRQRLIRKDPARGHREADISFIFYNCPSAQLASGRVPANCQMQVWKPQGDFFYFHRV